MFMKELLLLIPSLLGQRYVMVNYSPEKDDFVVRRIRTRMKEEGIECYGRGRVRIKKSPLLGISNYSGSGSVALRVNGTAVPFSDLEDASPYISGWWRPFCPFGVGFRYKLFQDYYVHKTKEEITGE